MDKDKERRTGELLADRPEANEGCWVAERSEGAQEETCQRLKTNTQDGGVVEITAFRREMENS